ncbi:PTS system mannose/fructose/sorbose family transporter subunit IID [Propionispora hippei]|uniref:PTS system IID component, Man family n=1 Tax=Propionispora hippei DSM 15287 TaxID=1123003 RepID=A0A1M6MLQ7_9FIRM|nr:PTS system mannose/fructose/sorbose family transporter subunit IID [Propionispora hippei]SHJ84326.1 PTS system IID component, Man family [Propionispora hippei DSM 15287]
MVNNEQKLIPKNALIRAALIWETWVQTCYNYERMMGMACAHTFLPVVKYLYPNNKEKQIDLMTRQMEFFNVHPEFGSCILGLAISLEEEKAMGKDIPNEFITNIKTSLMGPLAGIGDTIYQGVLIPILLALCIDITRSGDGNIWGAVIYAVVMFAITYIISVGNFMFGYHAGSDAIMDFLERGILNKLLKGASIMGCMVMGGLIVNYVKVTCGLTVVTSGAEFSLQKSLFDAILPHILPLAATMGVYGLLQKKWTSVRIILLMVVIGVVGGFFNIFV